MVFKCAECGLECINMHQKTFPKPTDDYDFYKVSNGKYCNGRLLKVFIKCDKCDAKLEIREKGHHKISYDVKKYGTSCEECMIDHYYYGIHIDSFPKSLIEYLIID